MSSISHATSFNKEMNRWKATTESRNTMRRGWGAPPLMPPKGLCWVGVGVQTNARKEKQLAVNCSSSVTHPPDVHLNLLIFW